MYTTTVIVDSKNSVVEQLIVDQMKNEYEIRVSPKINKNSTYVWIGRVDKIDNSII